MKQFIFRCLPLVLLAACNSNSTQNTAENADAAKTKVRADSTKAAAATKTVYTAGVDNLRIRETPTADGKVITTVKKGETLNLTGKKSAEKVTMDLQGEKVTDVFSEVSLTHGGQEIGRASCRERV